MGNNNGKIIKYNHEDIIKWLENKFKNEGIYRDLEDSVEFQAEVKRAKKQGFIIYPRISIDLLRVVKQNDPSREKGDGLEQGNERPKQINYYTLFFAISCLKNMFKTETEKRDLKKRLLFYQYYFSRITASDRVQTIIVVPDSNDNIPSEFLQFLKDNKFGLWKIKIEEKGGRETVECEPKSFGARIREEVDAFRKDPKKTVKDSFFDEYSRSAVNAMAGVTSDMFGERYIDRKLLTRMLDLEMVEYGGELKRLVNEQLDGNSSDYQFVTEVFNVLWQKYIGIPYSKFLKTFEPVLLHVFAEGEEVGEKYYRDHYIHQFQVFLLGLYFIDCFYERFKMYIKPEVSWLVAATFHDMAYPIQKLDVWIERFFKEAFLAKKLGHIELDSHFIKQGFLRSFNFIMEQFCIKIMKEPFCGDWLAKEDDILQCFYEHITGTNKQHCLLSSISLLKLLYHSKKIEVDDIEIGRIFKEIIVPSALAIALHDHNVWGKLNNDNYWKSNRGNCPLLSLEFERDPLSFLLIFCDSAQEWGRPHLKDEKKPTVHKKKKEGEEEEELAGIFRLKTMECTREKGLQVTLYSPKHDSANPRFTRKVEELKTLQQFLIQPEGLEFTIFLSDKNVQGEPLRFSMTGPSASSQKSCPAK